MHTIPYVLKLCTIRWWFCKCGFHKDTHRWWIEMRNKKLKPLTKTKNWTISTATTTIRKSESSRSEPTYIANKLWMCAFSVKKVSVFRLNRGVFRSCHALTINLIKLSFALFSSSRTLSLFHVKNYNISNVHFRRRHKTIQSIDNDNGNSMVMVMAMPIATTSSKNAPCNIFEGKHLQKKTVQHTHVLSTIQLSYGISLWVGHSESQKCAFFSCAQKVGINATIYR